MMLKRDWITLTGVLLTVSATPLTVNADAPAERTGATPASAQYVPAHGVRESVARIDVSQVVGINFGMFYLEGHYAGLMTDDKSINSAVTDAKLIDELLQALHQALEWPQVGGSFGNENPDQISILLKPRGGITPSPILLRCDYTQPGRCFGPEFFAAMHGVEQDRAEQVRRFIRERGGQIRAIALDDEVPVGAKERRRLIMALSRVDRRAFMFTSDPTEEFSPLLVMQDGKHVYICFRFRSPVAGGHETPPLPSALWSAYLRNRTLKPD